MFILSLFIGIGTYLVRLSQRVIQVDNSSIILTGYTALNKLLGREVYTSNTQLGGIQIMHNNGVSHATAPNDVEGVKKILKWLSYFPKKKGGTLPILKHFNDPIDRHVEYRPRQNQVYDPRWLIGTTTQCIKERFPKEGFPEIFPIFSGKSFPLKMERFQ